MPVSGPGLAGLEIRYEEGREGDIGWGVDRNRVGQEGALVFCKQLGKQQGMLRTSDEPNRPMPQP